MDKKLFVAVIVAVVVIGVIAGCVEEPAPEVTPTPETTPTPKVTPEATPAPTPAVAVEGISCDFCHIRELVVEKSGHVEGEQSCMGSKYGPCHSAEKYGGTDANVHTIHPSEAVGCVACHGKIPTIPQTGPGGTSCEMCHGMPNPLKPSEGRLVEIHLERGRDCQVCHVGEIADLHKGVI